MQQVHQVAVSAGHAALATHCTAAIAHDRTVHDLEARWLGQSPDVQFSPEARQLDLFVDAALGTLRDGLDAAARASAPDDPLGDAAAQLGKELFPRGVADITTRPFVEELEQVARILSVVGSAAWSQKIEALGLTRHVVRLTALEQKYRAAIDAPGAAKVAFGEVKNARAKGQSLLLQAVAMILGLHPSDSEADLAARAQLLGPILKQNEAIRDYLRARRAVQDVNPETGEVEGGAGAGGGTGAGGVPGGDGAAVSGGPA